MKKIIKEILPYALIVGAALLLNRCVKRVGIHMEYISAHKTHPPRSHSAYVHAYIVEHLFDLFKKNLLEASNAVCFSQQIHYTIS